MATTQRAQRTLPVGADDRGIEPVGGGVKKVRDDAASPRRRGGRRSCSSATDRSPRSPDPTAGWRRSVRSRMPEMRTAAAGRDPGQPGRRSPPRRRSGCRRRGSDADGGGGRHHQIPLLAADGAEVQHAERSATSQVSSSRSATVCRMCGSVVRAVTTSPCAGRHRRRCTAGHPRARSPGPARARGELPCSSPSRRRRTVSSRRRQGRIQPSRVGRARRGHPGDAGSAPADRSSRTALRRAL